LTFDNGKYPQASAPYEGLSHGFTHLSDAMSQKLARMMPFHQVAGPCRVFDHKPWNIRKQYSELTEAEADHLIITRIRMDETADR
jgi:hypothetical protein